MKRTLTVAVALVLVLASCGPSDIEPAEIATVIPGVSTSEAATLAPLLETAQAVLEPSEVATIVAVTETEDVLEEPLEEVTIEPILEPSEVATIEAIAETAVAVIDETATPEGMALEVAIQEILSAPEQYIGCTVMVTGQIAEEAGANTFILVPAGMVEGATVDDEMATATAEATETLTADEAMETTTETAVAMVDETATAEDLEGDVEVTVDETATAGDIEADADVIGDETATAEAMGTALAVPCPLTMETESATETAMAEETETAVVEIEDMETATALIEDMETATALIEDMETATAGDMQLLVVVPNDLNPVTTEGGMVQVTGLVWEFDRQQLEQRTNVQIQDELISRFNGQPILIASQIDPMEETGMETATPEAMETATADATEMDMDEEMETATPAP